MMDMIRHQASEQLKHMKSNMKYSSLTTNKRSQLAGSMDKFCTFSWCGVSAWDTFGVFIINEKNDLKFYNGPQFSNTYATPQYNTSALLEGVSFKTQQIKFKIGVYWISDEDYREFMNWLNPYSIGMLVFDFNREWGYRSKLASREDSTRWVVGYELDEEGNSCRRYYTEMNLTFEVQGEPCAIATDSYRYTSGYANDTYILEFFQAKQSDLPINYSLDIQFNRNSLIQNYGLLKVEMCYKNNTFEVFLLQWSEAFLQYLASSEASSYDFIIHYDSESGIAYQKYGNQTFKLLSLWSTIENGEKILSSMIINKSSFPGRFNIKNIDMSDISLKIYGITNDAVVTLSAFARTNVI